MSPGGHLVTTAIAGAAVYAATGSAPLLTGLVAGGFLIDIDHALDYVLFEGQRDLRPGAFLRYYLSDIIFNGRIHARSLVPFYSFAYRCRVGFRSADLIGLTPMKPAGNGFWSAFFRGAVRTDAKARPSLASRVSATVPEAADTAVQS